MLHNEPTKDKQVHTILVRWLFISSTPTHNLELMKIVGGHGSNSQTGQVIFGSIDHNWFFAKTVKTLFNSAQTLSVHSIFQRNLLVFFEHCLMLSLWNTPPNRSSLWSSNLPPHYWGTTLCYLHPFLITVVIRLSPHLDLGVLMRTYPNVVDLALYCSSLWIGLWRWGRAGRERWDATRRTANNWWRSCQEVYPRYFLASCGS